ncbi:MAG: hypothetical protein JMN27_11970 [gamma proteobacterium endosymbiont of Lamellibrachia anaximandri]|nr:hypothetical protein [gamma proteobacterium endosymbiont of Lamellibrachia anaximandri]MBL3534538.1 hypothetical protein [gamma proteobacterium endosymbiont of Lamellibrachia anaximandri]
MLPILFGLIAATLFGLFAVMTYGVENIIYYPWVEIVFWTLIATGAGVTVLGELNQCLPCKLKERFNFNWLETLCQKTPCAG